MVVVSFFLCSPQVFDLVSSLLIDFLNCNKFLLFSSCVLEYEGSGPIYLNKQNEPDWLVTWGPSPIGHRTIETVKPRGSQGPKKEEIGGVTYESTPHRSSRGGKSA